MILLGGDGGPEPLRWQRQAPRAFQRPLTEGGESGWGLWMMGAAIMDRGVEARLKYDLFSSVVCEKKHDFD